MLRKLFQMLQSVLSTRQLTKFSVSNSGDFSLMNIEYVHTAITYILGSKLDVM